MNNTRIGTCDFLTKERHGKNSGDARNPIARNLSLLSVNESYMFILLNAASRKKIGDRVSVQQQSVEFGREVHSVKSAKYEIHIGTFLEIFSRQIARNLSTSIWKW